MNRQSMMMAVGVGAWAALAPLAGRSAATLVLAAALALVLVLVVLYVGRREEHRRAEALRRQRQWLATTLASIADGVIATDGEGRVVFLNPVAEGLTGWSQGETVGRPIRDIFPIVDEGTGQPAEHPAELAIRQGVAVAHRGRAVLTARDGRKTPVDVSAAPIRADDGRTVGVVKVFRDVSAERAHEEALRAAKEEAEQANRAKDQFLAVLSHELRTPLNPILLAATALLEQPPSPEEVRPTLQMIRQNVNLQARLIDDLLDVMRIVRGKMPLHWDVVDGHELIRQSIYVTRSDAYGKEIHVVLDLAAVHPHVNADAARLQQVFWNLIKNAVKFTPKGGAVTVSTRNEPAPDGAELLLVEVRDNGVGIAPEVLPTIWDPFQQGGADTTRQFGGLGLGLAISKGIIEAHGGTISAESAGEGRGATFRVALKALPPPAVKDARDSGARAARASTCGGRPCQILVVEDDPVTSDLLARLLRRQGHDVATADTVAAALEATAGRQFDLIISDIGLPDGSGLDLMRRIVEQRGRVPAIALTGYGMDEDIQRSRDAGFAAHMTKPIDFTRLEALMHQVLA